MGHRGIFICYRREDSRWPARALAEALRLRFGNENVFMDVDTARIGNWRSRINESLEASAVVVVLIGPRWLDEFEKRTEGTDEVRYEIAEAIRRGMILLPVTLGSTRVPERRSLPDDIAPLTDEEVYQLGEDKYWGPTLAVLIKDLEQALGSGRAEDGGGAPTPERIAVHDDGKQVSQRASDARVASDEEQADAEVVRTPASPTATASAPASPAAVVVVEPTPPRVVDWSGGTRKVERPPTGTIRGELRGARSALGANGRIFAFAVGDAVHVWTLDPLNEVCAIRHHTRIDALAIAPDGSHLAIGDHDGGVDIFELRSGRKLQRIAIGHQMADLAIAPHGGMIAVASTTPPLWSVETAEPVDLQGEGRFAQRVAFNRDGSRVAAMVYSAIHVWDIQTRLEVGRSKDIGASHGLEPPMRFSFDGQWIVSASRPPSGAGLVLKTWHFASDIASFATRPAPLMFNEELRLATDATRWELSPDGRFLATFGSSSPPTIWKLPACVVVEKLDLDPTGGPELLTFRDDGGQIVSLERDGHVNLWEPRPIDLSAGVGRTPFQVGSDEPFAPRPEGPGRWAGGIRRVGDVLRLSEGSGLTQVAITRDGSSVVTVRGEIATIWNLSTGTELLKVVHKPEIGTFAFNPKADRLATLWDGVVRIWAVPEGTELAWFDALDASGGASSGSRRRPRQRPDRKRPLIHPRIALSPDGATVAIAGGYGTTRLWDCSTGRPRDGLEFGDAVHVELSDDGTMLATADTHYAAHVWEVASGRQLASFPPGVDVWTISRTLALDWRRRLATNCSDGFLRVWDLATRELMASLPKTFTKDLRFGPDGGCLATAGRPGHLYALATSEIIGTFGDTDAVAFTSDGQGIVTVSGDSVSRWEPQNVGASTKMSPATY